MNVISKYEAKLETQCLAIFDSNSAPYFASHERKLFAAFLKDENEVDDYYVITTEEGLVACGGFILVEPNVIELNWGMVRRDTHRSGLGRELLEFRLKLIAEKHPKAQVRIDTSQHTEGFFCRYGFQTTEVVRDGFGPELNKVTMILRGS